MTLTPSQSSFASDLARLPEWQGPKKIEDFTDDDRIRFAAWLRNDDGTLSEADRELCEEIASAIENA